MSIPPLKVSTDYINWILQTNRGIMAHLYKFVSIGGAVDLFTDFDTDINYNSSIWKSNSLRFEGLRRKIGVGLAIDEQTVKIWAQPSDTLFNANFLTGAEQGLLDGALLTRYRIIWQFVTGNVASDIQQVPLAVIPLFTGYTSNIVKGGVSHIEVKFKSALVKLNVNMPRNYYQPGCLWTLFDTGCTLAPISFRQAGTIDVGTNNTTLPLVGGVNTPTGGDGLPNYAQGKLLIASGVNENLLILIDNNDNNNLYLATPLDTPCSPGDSIFYYSGCSKSYNTCLTKFSNEANFRGFDKVPPIMVSV